MSLLLQGILFVIVGTAIFTAGTMGLLLLIMRLQGTPIPGNEDQAIELQPASGTQQPPILLEVDGKRFAVQVDVHLQRL